MPLNVDKLTSYTISLAHNEKQNGDVMEDPDMEVKIYPEMKMAVTLIEPIPKPHLISLSLLTLQPPNMMSL